MFININCPNPINSKQKERHAHNLKLICLEQERLQSRLNKTANSVTHSHILTIENILESCVVELENIDGMMKLRSDISSNRLFCKGVPVSNIRCSAYRNRKRERA